MQRDDEITAAELDRILQAEGIKLSRSTILRCHQKLGWTIDTIPYGTGLEAARIPQKFTPTPRFAGSYFFVT